MTANNSQSTRTLSNGAEIPVMGLGVWQADDGPECERAVAWALEEGYRLIDTAQAYGNESSVGRAIRSSGIPREEIFLTTKFYPGSRDPRVEAEKSLGRLGTDYLDLYLIHWPLPRCDRYLDTWRAFIELRERGLVRSIGVSNFTPTQIERLVSETGVWPVVNQIELHPEFSQERLRAWHTEHRVVTQAWSPLGAGTDILNQPEITDLAAAHDRTPAQIVLRWHVQLGDVPIPKSAQPARMAQNLSVFDFALSDQEMAVLDALDRGNRLGGDPDHHVEL
jgi:diketogulonate reductase-like aldo/keto reductase